MDDILTINKDLELISPSKSYICLPEEINNYLKSDSASLKLLHLNIRSINRNFNSLLVLLHRIKYQLDIIVLSECWLSKAPTIPSLDGFQSFASTYSNQNEGVVVYIRSHLICTVQSIKIDEANSLIVKLENDVVILALYRSPSYKNINVFLNSIDQALNLLNV